MNRRATAPTCSAGHVIATTYTLEQARVLDVIVFTCDVCNKSWEATPEERDAFLRYLEERPEDVVPS
jgi:hypothetical protein